eukprot:CAMPEP_0196577350 /NCGR_PEP_ID=MMETSP1081-20130531/6425_1 /TAXON_ID=36882 /ORGANISM="Pyramimonas amylifera, Strain CCMP720" /LENGTH=168 /DNA_ID=CAMNT_0041896243 /DNA_START=459 /DNA_END=961 /DNA_ORIENTATION=-
MRNAMQLWDFSPHNCKQIHRMTGRKCVYVPSYLSDTEHSIVPFNTTEYELDALFFGELCERRASVCKELEARGLRVGCVDHMFGIPLDTKIRLSKIVFVEQCHIGDVLAVDRINRALLLGVPVIASRSADSRLDEEYSKMGVVFSHSNLANDSVKLLNNSFAMHSARL